MKKLKKTASALCMALLCMSMVNNVMAAVVTYYHNDISGSPIAATDAAGKLLWKENYKPYGDKLNRTASSGSNKIGFHGKAYDDATGLSYMGHDIMTRCWGASWE
ncbi:RHS domain-containing protein [Pseudomonas qingdaonensis]|nr:RHS domain-containing protein [Pseudomonas qingdaonensis]